MLLRKALRSKAERDALADLGQALDDKLPIAVRELRTFISSDATQPDRDTLLTILNTGAIPSSVTDKLRRQYTDCWSETLGHHVGDAVTAGESYTGLNLNDSGIRAEYVQERGDLWIKLMADAQLAAYREVRNVCRNEGVPRDDALDLMVLATGLSPQEAGALARRQAALVEEVKKALGSTLVRQAATLLQSRAMRTAEYELARAYNEAKRRAWALAERIGLVQQPTKTWVAAEEPGPDSRVCPLCTKLNGKSVAVNEEFETGISGPPRHIRCRCSLTMSEKG